MDCSPPGSSVHGMLQKNTGVGCHFLLQGIFPTQGWKLHILHWQVDSLPSEPPGKSALGKRSVLVSLSHNYGYFFLNITENPK